MQSLWFRAAQTRSLCHCNACVKIGTIAARQTTNASGKRRRVSLVDVFTACYSTILATAAMADSNRKARRRKHWDVLIAEARAGFSTQVEELQDSQVEGDANEVKNQIPGAPAISKIPGSLGGTFLSSKTGINATKAGHKRSLIWDGTRWTAGELRDSQVEGDVNEVKNQISGTSEIPTISKSLGETFPSRTGNNATKAGHKGPLTWDGTSWTPASSIARLGTQLNTSPEPPEIPQDPVLPASAHPAQSATPEIPTGLLADGERLGEYIPQHSMLKPREPKTRKQLNKIEESTSKLVHQLMWTTKLSPIAADLHSASPAILAETDRLIGRIEELEQGDITMPAYKLDDKVCEERCHLHDVLKELLMDTSQGEIELNLILAKICYNLLVSPASPNIFTYNFLIERFTELMLHDHAQVLVDSFLNDTPFKPTSKTVQVILNHYAAKNDLVGYRSIIKRMRAVEGSMNIARRHTNQLDDPKVLRWAEKYAKTLTLREGWLVRKVPRDTSIFDILIRTSLQITNARQSVMYIRAKLREGNGIEPDLLCETVASCVPKIDYAVGGSLLQSILEGWGEEVKNPRLIVLNKDTRWAIRELFSLCGMDPLRSIPRVLPIDVPRWNLGRLLFYVNLGSIRDRVDRLVHRINSLLDVFRIYTKRSTLTNLAVWKAGFGSPLTFDYLPKRLELQNQSSCQSEVDRALEIFDKFSYTEEARAYKLKRGVRQARRVMLQTLESKVTTSFATIRSTKLSLISWYYDQLPRDWRYVYHLKWNNHPYMSFSGKVSVLRGIKTLQRLHLIGYQLNKSLQQIVLLKKALRDIWKEREQRIIEIEDMIKKSKKLVRLLEIHIYLLEQNIKFRSQYLRLSGLRNLSSLENEVNGSRRQIKLLEEELKLEFPQVDPLKKLRALNLILFDLNKSKHQLKLLADEISFWYPVVIRKNFITSDIYYYKVLQKFRKDLSFRYEPPKDFLSLANEKYRIIKPVSAERLLRFKKLQGHLSFPAERISQASDAS
ncbi:hypothetical protein DSL72_007240 [Monilinia vaccinii-corymbosi]|uniref:Pentatricopeptide repeat domain-containing protein n=1 Tax=Monilinia vaccinii-corymbosi TaxID=61207 RepID=A0A8A3PMC9_9HELO|nr:hypothetical protein DSL72_007240 [Monilinia vaccinii-corymbosi]